MTDHTDDTATTAAPKGLTREGTPRERKRFDVSSQWIADKTGYSRTGVYRMREEGNRDTTLNLVRMERMETVFGWKVEDQLEATRAGRWADEFENVVTAAYAKETKS